MLKNYTESSGFLDKMLHKSGSEILKANFLKTAQKDRKKAIALINYSGLRFTTLYILLPEIDLLNLYADLNLRNRIAFALCAKILVDLQLHADVNEQLSESNNFIHSVLKWMFITGARDDGLSNEFDQVLDVVASHLTRTYQDTAILPELVRIIFKRNRKGYYIHDLVWALFGSRNQRILKLIAAYLNSQRKPDVALASKLLCRPLSEKDGKNPSMRKQYASYLSWFNENKPYLYFTGEGFHQTSDPTPCDVDLGAKFLCKKISPTDRKLLVPLTEDEHNHLNEFDGVESAEKILLATHSQRLHSKNRKRWNRWRKYSIDKQIEIARNWSGGMP